MAHRRVGRNKQRELLPELRSPKTDRACDGGCHACPSLRSSGNGLGDLVPAYVRSGPGEGCCGPPQSGRRPLGGPLPAATASDLPRCCAGEVTRPAAAASRIRGQLPGGGTEIGGVLPTQVFVRG
jgi:hypothetical protein